MNSSALIIVDDKLLLPHILNYLYKFNFKNVVLFKKKNFKINLNLLKGYNFNITILNYTENQFNYNLLKNKEISKHLDNNFLLLKTSRFINLNLFNLYKIYLKNNNKLTLTIHKKNNRYFNTEIFFIKKKILNYYDFAFIDIFKNPNYKLNFTDNEFINLRTIKLKKKKIINNFFSNIYSRAVILDRDGVINVNKGYVGFKKDFVFQSGAIKAIKYLNKFNYNIFVVSNQSGIARGYYTDNDVKKLHNYLRDTLEKKQIFINKIYYSPYHKDGIIKKYIKNSSCRKPGIKLFSTLSKEWGIKNKSKIIMIGDQASDIEFAKNAKIKSALFKKGNLYNFIKKLGLSEKI